MTKRTKLEGLQPRRKRAGMTQADVADALGIERATVGMWETGTSWPSARVLPDLAGLLCCSIDELYTAPEEDPSTRPAANASLKGLGGYAPPSQDDRKAPESDTSSGAAAPPSPQEEGKGFFPQGEGKEEAG